MPLRSLFVDFNSYFASVEQQERPELRGIPVGIVPVDAESTCCIAASYEAKRHGVKTGTRVSDARVRCKGIRIVEARPELYVRYHKRLIEAVESCMHVSQICSIDEMACDLTGRHRQREQALLLAEHIKQTISERVGPFLKSSIGIAPNRFLAKTASDMQKPDGLVVIEQEELPSRLHSLKLRDLCGIGEAMEIRLRRQGIYTVEQLCSASKPLLRRAWGGILGERFFERLRGEDIIDSPTERSSVGHSRVLPPALRTEALAYAMLHRLLQKAASRLRKLGFYCGRVSMGIQYMKGPIWSRDITCFETQDTIELARILDGMWGERPKLQGRAKPLLVNVTLSNLVSILNHTPSLFDQSGNRSALNEAVDALNSRFGAQAVYLASAHEAREAVPTRIAFTSIPELPEGQ